MIFSKFSELCNHHHDLVLEYFYCFKKISYPFAVNLLYSYLQLRQLVIYVLSQRIAFSEQILFLLKLARVDFVVYN